MRVRLVLLVPLVILSHVGTVDAQLGPAQGPPILPPTPIVAPDSPIALAVDPAALAFLPRMSVMYAHGEAPNGSRRMITGDSLYFAGTIGGRIGLGLGFEHGRPFDGASYGRFSLGVAAAAGRRASLGFALRHVASASTADSTTVDLSVSVRPLSSLGMAFVAANVLGPAGLAATGGRTMPAVFVAALTWRPLGTPDFMLDAAYVFDSDRRRAGRFYAAADVLGVVRISGQFEVGRVAGEPDYRGLVGAELFYRGLRVAGGAALSTAQTSTGYYVAAGIEVGANRESVLPPKRVLDLDVEGGVGARRIVAIVLALENALHDRGTGGVLLRLRRTGLGLAQAQEIHQLVAALVQAGKPVVCRFEEPRGSELYACANATRTFIDPAGYVRLVGPAIQVVLLGGLLERIGVHADFVRVGEYKTATEQLMNEALSGPGREQEDALVGDLHARLVQDLAADRGMTSEAMSALVDRGPFTAEEAEEAHLVDGRADGDWFRSTYRATFGHMARRRSPSEIEPDRSFGVPPRVAVVVVDGSIIDGDNLDIPFVDIHASGANTLVATLDRLAGDHTVAAVVLRVDSGGGSALASDRIYRAVQRVARRKPVVASLGSVAASGGYYIAAATREIFADPSTVTGSIGVFFGKVDVSELASRIGVNVEEFRRGAHAGSDSPYRAYTDEERARLTELIEASYRTFLSRVAEGRSSTVEEIEPLARGRVYSGDAASRVHLVDRLGGLGAALARARELGHLDPDSEVVVVPSRPNTILEYLVGARDESREMSASPLPAGLAHHLERLVVLGTMGDGAALAMQPFSIEE